MKILCESGAFLKAGLIVAIGIAGVLMLAAGDGRSMAQNATIVPDGFTISANLNDVVVDNPGYKEDRRGPVILSHTKHAKDYGVSCWECHHDYKKDKINTWSPLGETQPCNECHDPLKVKGNAMRLQTAYHLECKGCHKELAIEHKKTGAYRECLECHEKIKHEDVK